MANNKHNREEKKQNDGFNHESDKRRRLCGEKQGERIVI